MFIDKSTDSNMEQTNDTPTESRKNSINKSKFYIVLNCIKLNEGNPSSLHHDDRSIPSKGNSISSSTLTLGSLQQKSPL